MSESTQVFTIEGEAPVIETRTEYGMAYPNGTILWKADNYVSFKALAEGDTSAEIKWDGYLADRAKAARVPLDAYKAGHQLIKRTYTVAVTASEDVTA